MSIPEMTNPLRVALTLLVKGHAPEDIIQILSEAIDDHAVTIARSTGDYERADVLRRLARELAAVEDNARDADRL